MDPTFADHLRRYLAVLVFEHRNVEPPAAGCMCGDLIEEGSLADHVLDVMAKAIAEPELVPRVVHVPASKQRTERARTYDASRGDRKRPDGEDEAGLPYWGIDVVERVTPPPSDCPDCGGGLRSRGGDLICLRLSRDLELHGCHDHPCIVACGVTNG